MGNTAGNRPGECCTGWGLDVRVVAGVLCSTGALVAVAYVLGNRLWIEPVALVALWATGWMLAFTVPAPSSSFLSGAARLLTLIIAGTLSSLFIVVGWAWFEAGSGGVFAVQWLVLGQWPTTLSLAALGLWALVFRARGVREWQATCLAMIVGLGLSAPWAVVLGGDGWRLLGWFDVGVTGFWAMAATCSAVSALIVGAGVGLAGKGARRSWIPTAALVLAVIPHAPLWAWSAELSDDYYEIDPHHPSFCLLDAKATRSGDSYLLVAQMDSRGTEGPVHVATVDEEGSWRRIGPVGYWPFYAGSLRANHVGWSSWPRATRVSAVGFTSPWSTSEDPHFIDVASGDRLDPLRAKKSFQGDVARNPWILPSGEEAWIDGTTMFLKSEGVVHERPLPEGFEPAYLWGYGIQGSYPAGSRILDLRTGRLHDRKEVSPDDRLLWILADGRWLVEDGDEGSYSLLDPNTRDRQVASFLPPGSHPWVMVDDDLLLVSTKEPRRWELVSLTNQSAKPITIRGVESPGTRWIGDVTSYGAPAWVGEDRLLVLGPIQTLAVLRIDEGTLEALVPIAGIVSVDDGHVTVIDASRRRLLKVDPHTKTVQTLFPAHTAE